MIAKRLTADEVAAKRFTPVRLREGYSMDEVDAFLDEVEGTLTEQEKEIKELQLANKQGATAALVQSGVAEDTAPLLAELADAREQIAKLERDLAEARSATPAAAPAPSTGLAEAAASATRMLEMAAVQHDELIAQGHATSEKLLSDARERIAAEEAAAAEARQAQMGSLEAEKAALETAIHGLRELETTSRSALQSHFEEKLRELSAAPIVDVAAVAPVKASKNPVDAPPAEEVVADPAEAPPTSTIPTAPIEAPAQEPAPEAGPPKAYQEFPSFYGNAGGQGN